MDDVFEPEVGSWYEDETGNIFTVLDVDREGEFIEIQFLDGTVEELELGNWYEMRIQPCAEPEDWSGPYDNVTAMDMDEADEAFQPHVWSSPAEEEM